MLVARWLAVAVMLLSVSGCGVVRAIMPVAHLVIDVQTGVKLNPMPSGKPAPLSIYLFQMKKSDDFTKAKFFDLYDKGQQILADNFVSLTKTELTPSTKARLSLLIKPGTKFVGIVAAYRDINAVQWRKVIPITFSFGRKKIRLRFTQTGIDQYSIIKNEVDVDVNKPNIDKDKYKKQGKAKLDQFMADNSGPDLQYQVIDKQKG